MMKRSKEQREKSYLSIEFITIALAPIFFTLISQAIFKKSIIKSFMWIAVNPISFILNYFVALSMVLILAAILNIRLSIILTSIIVIFTSLISYVKFSLRGVPLLPQDIYLIKEVSEIKELVVDIKFILFVIGALILIIAITLITRFIPRVNMGVLNRIIYLSISIVLLLGLNSIKYIDRYSIYRQNISLENTGFLLFFFENMQYKSNDNFQVNIEISEDLKESLFTIEESNITKTEKPDIIVIMNEAFWDPNILNGIKFNKNPTEFIDKLKQNCIHGYLESPEFGGGTANAEFELLTGYSMHFYNPGFMVYPNEIKQPIMSIPSVLKTQGYTTKAIHPFKGWYWNRKEVYKYFGFDEFISEECLIDPEYKGFYVSDEYVTDIIINELEESDNPKFIFAVTMQNHGPYNDDRYKNYQKDIQILNKLDSESVQILETYSQGIYDADKALEKLINYCNKSKKPTVVLFFGDHLPMLGTDLKVYKEFGFVEGNGENNDKLKLSSTPFILWSNYDSSNEDIGVLNMSFMAPYLLKYAGLEMPKYYNFIYNLSKEMPVISRVYAIDKNNNFISCEDEIYRKYSEIYKEFQYDLMYSKKNLIEDYSKWIVENNINNILNSMKKIP